MIDLKHQHKEVLEARFNSRFQALADDMQDVAEELKNLIDFIHNKEGNAEILVEPEVAEYLGQWLRTIIPEAETLIQLRKTRRVEVSLPAFLKEKRS